MALNIKYGKNLEVERIQKTLTKMNWYNQQGYRSRLPKNIDLKKISDDNLLFCVEEEYRDDDYNKISSTLEDEYGSLEHEYITKLKEVFGKHIPTNFEVTLTKYGVGGSYCLPNKVILNIFYIKKPTLKENITHEICHLMIEELVLKYDILQFEKERTVDLILNSKRFNFLYYNYWQDSYKGAEEYIDELFAKTFFDSPETFFKGVSDARKKNQ